ncbi:pseudouridine synthase [Pontibacillus chungwhensis BH030062]|uniref:Pseudouridine synthase n=1 Tax=Pontibacillus chungwhensis BH030062 TaxID=1385513 RepID=A0A0A2UQM9_9BACI|nr:RluA family pseudouridine synthase [Pontibacillus chungwhensis]KGP90607.1 pseudouridine synthase [Pontibacillus chungwhensis BH030062]
MQLDKRENWMGLEIPSKWNGSTIEVLLRDVWQIPKKQLHQIRMDKGVLVNNEQKRWSETLNEGDYLEAQVFIPEESDVVPEQKNVEILFEDDHILVANKPAGMDTHPNEKGQTGTLLNAVTHHCGPHTNVRHIHRLDRETTGAILFAKHRIAGSIMDRLLEERKVKRAYLALVHGLVSKKKGTIDQAIGKDRHHATRKRVSPKGQSAVTDYEVHGYLKEKNATLVKLFLRTGRTHQIRVHMSHIGHPLLGDSLYGGKKNAAPRQALHAASLTFPHPFTGETITCEAPFIDQPPIFE